MAYWNRRRTIIVTEEVLNICDEFQLDLEYLRKLKHYFLATLCIKYSLLPNIISYENALY